MNFEILSLLEAVFFSWNKRMSQVARILQRNDQIGIFVKNLIQVLNFWTITF